MQSRGIMTTDNRGMVFNATFNNISVKNIGTVYLDIHSNCLMFYKSGSSTIIRNWKIQKNTQRDKRKCKIWNILEDEYHYFLNCNFNKENIMVTFLKYFKESHHSFNTSSKYCNNNLNKLT
jgi:hypothetical protein